MDFYVRNLEYRPSVDATALSWFTNVGQNSNTDKADSTFDVRYLKECFIYPAVYRNDSGDQANLRVSPASSEIFKIEDSPSGDYYGEFVSGAVGDSNRVLRLHANSNLANDPSAKRFNPNNVWDNVGFIDPYASAGSYTTFKTQICASIKLSIEQYNEIANISNWNVILYKYEYFSEIFQDYIGERFLVLYYAGNDPDADEVITVT